MFRIEIVQPSVPHYRASLFSALANRFSGAVTLHASREPAGGPPSFAVPELNVIEHTVLSSAGGRLLWQKSLRLPSEFGCGDVLVVAGNPRYLSNLPLILSARRRGAGVVWWGHGWSPTSVAWRARLRKVMMRLADVILLYADAEIPRLRAKAPRGTVVTATNNTLDPTQALEAQRHWPEERLLEFSRKHGLADREIILFCGRLRRTPPSDLATAIRAIAHGATTGRTPLLVVIGSGEEQPNLETLAAQLSVASSIRWLGAVYREEDLAPWFMLAHCFVYPGSIGLSLLHAFLYGLPVVTHEDVSLHNPEIHALRNNVNGKTFRRGDPHDLWRAIAEICDDVRARHAMSEAARRTALVEWSFDGMIQRFADAINEARSISLQKGIKNAA